MFTHVFLFLPQACIQNAMLPQDQTQTAKTETAKTETAKTETAKQLLASAQRLQNVYGPWRRARIRSLQRGGLDSARGSSSSALSTQRCARVPLHCPLPRAGA